MLFIVEVFLEIGVIIVEYIILETYKNTVKDRNFLKTCCVIRPRLPLMFGYPDQKKTKVAIYTPIKKLMQNYQ